MIAVARNRPLLIGGSLLGLLLLAALLARLWLPSLVLGRIEAALSRRELRIEVSEVAVSLGGIVLEGPRVYVAGAEQPLFRAEELSTEVDWTELGSGPRAALRELAIRGARFAIDQHAVAQLRARKPSGDPKGAAAERGTEDALPRVELHDAQLELRDAKGRLLSAKGLRLSVANGRFHASLGELTLGAEDVEVARSSELKVAGTLAGRRPVIDEASAGNAVFTWSEDVDEGEQGSAARRVIGRLRALLTRRGSRAPGAAQPVDIRSPDAGLVDRGAPELAADAGPAEPGPSAPALEPSDPPASPTPPMLLWSKDAKLSLPSLEVWAPAADGEMRKLLRALRVDVIAKGERAFTTKGQGSTGSGGDIAFDLRVDVDRKSVVGKLSLQELPLALFEPALPPLPYQNLGAARVSAQLSLAAENGAAVGFHGDVSVADLTFESSGLARSPVGPLHVAVSGAGRFAAAQRELVLEQATVALAGVKVGLEGALAWPEGGYRVRVKATLPRSPCAKVLAAVPAGVLEELAEVQLRGDFGFQIETSVDSAALDDTTVDFDFDDHCQFVALPEMLDLTRFSGPFLHEALEPDGSLFSMETGPGTPAWTPIELISPFLTQAVISHEDGRFFRHRGFAEREIGAALARNLKAKAFRYGASTITMQLVKNVFLHREKLLSRKVQEALITWWIEQQWDKKHILELYLNVIEYGPSIYGLRNAAWHYFGTIPMNLTPAQSAFLATILPSPKSAHRVYEQGTLSSSLKNRMRLLLEHMHARERIDDAALAYGLAELEAFSFYRPDQPPPLPPEIQGSAARLPFDSASEELLDLDEWDAILEESWDNGEAP